MTRDEVEPWKYPLNFMYDWSEAEAERAFRRYVDEGPAAVERLGREIGSTDLVAVWIHAKKKIELLQDPTDLSPLDELAYAITHLVADEFIAREPSVKWERQRVDPKIRLTVLGDNAPTLFCNGIGLGLLGAEISNHMYSYSEDRSPHPEPALDVQQDGFLERKIEYLVDLLDRNELR